MMQVFKIMHKMVGIKKENIFTMVDTERGTRGNSLKLQKQQARLRVRENVFSSRVVNTWNKLPDKVVLAPTVNMFKGPYADHILIPQGSTGSSIFLISNESPYFSYCSCKSKISASNSL